MAANLDYLLSTVERPLMLRARSDIQQVAFPVAGQPSYVLKDPLTLEHFQLTPAEHFLFEQLAQSTTLTKLKHKFEEQFAPRTITFVALQEGINQLFEQGLLVSLAPGQGKELLSRAAKKRSSERWQSVLRALSFRLASWDATTIVDRVYSKVRWVFSPLTLCGSLVLIVYAIWLLIGNFADVVAKFPSIHELWQPRYLVLWLVTVVGVKVLHEFSHALTCRHFGGRCHEMGVMLLVFFPALYCDVSDVWRLPSKWQRMAVTAAGMAVELCLAAIAFIGWWFTSPGLLNTWCLGMAVICSINTLAVNANPLLRFDGYYLLADWLEIPNLGGRAQELWGDRLRRWLLNEPKMNDPLLSQKQQQRLAIYCVASRIYSLVVLLAIYAMLFALARPYHLENIVMILAILTAIGLVMPFVQQGWQVLRNPANRARIQWPRLAMLLIVLSMFGSAILFWPVKHNVQGTAVLIPADGKAIYATTGGELVYAVPPGTRVRAGDVIAELRDPQLQLAVAKHGGEFEVKLAHFNQVNTLRALDSRMSLQLPTAQADLADAKAQLAQYERRERELVLRSPVDGIVITPPTMELPETEDRLPTWSGSPLESRNLGGWIEPGTVLCTVGDSRRLNALVAIDERDVGEIQPGEPVKILIDSAPVQIVTGKVKQVASRALEPSDDAQTSNKGRMHVVEVELDPSQVSAIVGSAGTAKIEASRSTLASLAVNFVKRRLKMPW